MAEENFEINPNAEVESQVDALFAPLYSLIPTQHHAAIEATEHYMISAVKSALRLPATGPTRPNPANWPWSSGQRLMRYLSPEEQREIREVHRPTQA